ncbi:hypothetical protein PHYPSEUDO_013779 [Phytophthora pseudosyringae]|uniref:Thaumatin-like protein n=1 Tax=Phytophthora pseudosyringae TaxID=221518 RepID=A0A8T1V9S3_9STRA|nr:hypothetical protein PHYPSEUDO_013779 [Phytophthora pseudosyringae]
MDRQQIGTTPLSQCVDSDTAESYMYQHGAKRSEEHGPSSAELMTVEAQDKAFTALARHQLLTFAAVRLLQVFTFQYRYRTPTHDRATFTAKRGVFALIPPSPLHAHARTLRNAIARVGATCWLSLPTSCNACSLRDGTPLRWLCSGRDGICGCRPSAHRNAKRTSSKKPPPAQSSTVRSARTGALSSRSLLALSPPDGSAARKSCARVVESRPVATRVGASPFRNSPPRSCISPTRSATAYRFTPRLPAMVMQTLSRALVGLALLNGVAQGFNVYVSNMCDEGMTLAHATPNGVETEQVSSGGTTTKSISAGTASHVLKWGTGSQATLAEFSGEGGKVWFDISIIPTGTKSGPGYCESLQACKDVTGGVGFNVAMQITPHSQDGARCVELTCMADGCADGYQFPKDDTKTHTCPLSTDFDLTFCPGGTGGSTPAPSPAPTQAPTPSPTPSPTPTPTPTPTSTSTPTPTEQQQQEEQTQTSKSASGSAGSAGQEPSTTQSSKSASGSDAEAGVNNLRKVNAESVQGSTTSQTSQTTGGSTQQIGQTPAAASKEDDVQKVSNKSGDEGTNGTPYIVLTVGGFVGMVAAAAIFVVRKKKAALDELESKTPMSTAAHGALANFRTPRDNVSVL